MNCGQKESYVHDYDISRIVLYPLLLTALCSAVFYGINLLSECKSLSQDHHINDFDETLSLFSYSYTINWSDLYSKCL